ncbi:alpha-ribazole-5'-phosphate phosphatase [Thiomicrorhabdus immobilis]|uniref:Alpha-ribazole-5'-phosphate phosphatase n=1 Tax=Thiomicrorhabdus immobilis TaxID=2791037 RepID=A0ABM7MCV5_9GAMM|nr:histidine phosphatase family protein [Thiomicrorhabdus immobilis]BCN93191.1 alpha-ribazole-5'-phosphate phosphatase [Thiomicrorhabdus immobilis]
MRIELLRHGECDDQAWLRGRVDSALGEQGWLQMHNQLKLLYVTDKSELDKPNMVKADVVISSPAKRCAEFAQKIYDQACSDNLVVAAPWQERDFGVFDGLPFDRVQQKYPQELERYLQNPYKNPIPKAESFADFKTRIQQAWSNLIHSDYQSVLLVTHSGPMRLVLQQILGFPDQQLFQLELGYGARISIDVIPTDTQPFCKLVEIVQSKTQAIG